MRFVFHVLSLELLLSIIFTKHGAFQTPADLQREQHEDDASCTAAGLPLWQGADACSTGECR